MTNFSLLPTEAVAASESTSANLSEAVLVGGADILSVAPDPLLSRVLYLRASAACAIAKGNVITVAGDSRRWQQLALSTWGVALRIHAVSAAQRVAEAVLDRTLVEQRAQLEAQRVELANTKATLSVLKEQEAQLLAKRRSCGSKPPTQVRRSPQRAPAESPAAQSVLHESLAAQTAADKAAAELIAEEQLAAIRQQQACVRTTRMKAKRQKHKQECQPGHTNFNKSAKGGQLAKSDCLAGKHAINVDAVFVELCQHQGSPQKDVAAPTRDTSPHMSYRAGLHSKHDQQWAGLPHCSDSSSSESSSTDEEQQMQKLLCCPITKITFVDPVIAADGHTYERIAMEHWMQHKSMSPVTGNLLPHQRLVPNMVIKSMVAAQSC